MTSPEDPTRAFFLLNKTCLKNVLNNLIINIMLKSKIALQEKKKKKIHRKNKEKINQQVISETMMN